MTYLGALIVVIAAFSVGIAKAKEEKRKVDILRELCSFLEVVKNEICTNKTPLKKLFKSESLKGLTHIGGFVSSVSAGFSELGEKRFCDIWSEALDDSLDILTEKSKSALLSLGTSLGRYDSEMQKCAIERCLHTLQNECEELEGSLPNNERMYIGLGGGAGLILALMLI